MSRTTAVWTAVGVFALLAFPALSIVPLAHSAGASPAAPPAIFHSSTTSTNWAGYAVSTTSGQVSFVNGSWTVPSIVGKCPKTALYSSFWIGIDGYTSSTVEQTGTDSDCQRGAPTYYAWYEFYPAGSVVIKTVSISAGDTILASVAYSPTTSKFTVTLTDVSTGKSFSTSAAVKSAVRSSAEWIAEAPSSIRGVLPLANFGTVDFGYDYTGLAGTGAATVGGTTGLMGSFVGLASIDMVSQRSSSTVKASTSAVSTDLSSFTVTWKSRGP